MYGWGRNGKEIERTFPEFCEPSWSRRPVAWWVISMESGSPGLNPGSATDSHCDLDKLLNPSGPLSYCKCLNKMKYIARGQRKCSINVS